MLDRFGEMAERMAEAVSRRALLGRLGTGAAALAGLLSGVLATPAIARTDTVVCCKYECSRRCGARFQTYCHPLGTTCPPRFVDRECACTLVKQRNARDCSRCR